MQLDGALFAIERRSAGGCIDLAVAFFREHMLTLMQLTACFAVPCCAFVWWVTEQTDAGLFTSVVVFACVSPLLGGALAVGGGQRVFGAPLTVSGCLTKLWKRVFTLMFVSLVVRLGCGLFVWVFILPAVLLANRYGFMAELLYLEQVKWSKAEKRISVLTKGYFSDLTGRLLIISFFYMITVISLFAIADTVGTLLLGSPILFSRLTFGPDWLPEMWDLLWTDSLITTVMHASLWLAYPICRLAWLFCYLDLRIRREGWDIDLDCRIEAKRLEAALG
jgi:hypothetical protein